MGKECFGSAFFVLSSFFCLTDYFVGLIAVISHFLSNSFYIFYIFISMIQNLYHIIVLFQFSIISFANNGTRKEDGKWKRGGRGRPGLWMVGVVGGVRLGVCGPPKISTVMRIVDNITSLSSPFMK